ncbi:MAG: 50S ribosomal protein L1 [Acidiferrobacterales bacterium]|nr:50S ribosomal protein L1 [Acidiferrobacterales bacterium]
MARVGKRLRSLYEKIESGQEYSIDDALRLVKESGSCKFDESVDVAVNLGIDAKKSDQNVRGTTVLPRGTGKTVRVAVFAEGEQAEAARQAGADIVGFQDLADKIKAGELNFDTLIATPDAMKIVGKLGPILGPRGLMPNPKVGTVTANVAKAVENAKAGQVQYRNDKAGIVHCAIGKASFEVDALKENLLALMEAVRKAKPANSKGIYLKKVTVSTTMGPGIQLDTRSI